MAEYRLLSVASIDRPRYPLRSVLDVEELAASIKELGLIQPILVRPLNGRFEIVHGDRRYNAFCKARPDESIPALVRELNDQQAFEVMVTENVQKQDLDPFEEGRAYLNATTKGVNGHIYRQDELGQKIGKSRNYVSDRIHLIINLSPNLRAHVPNTSSTLLAELSWIQDKQVQDELFQKVRSRQDALDIVRKVRPLIKQGLSVDEALSSDAQAIVERKVEVVKEHVKQLAKDANVKVDLDTADGQIAAARLLAADAKKKQAVELSPEEQARIEEEKQRVKAERDLKAQQRRDEKQRKEQEQLEQLKAEAKQQAEAELLNDKGFIQKAAEIAPTITEPNAVAVPKVADLMIEKGAAQIRDSVKEALQRVEDTENRPSPLFQSLKVQAVLESVKEIPCPMHPDDPNDRVIMIQWRCGHTIE